MKNILIPSVIKPTYGLLPKIPMRMRIATVLLAGFLIQANAETSYSQEARISLEMRNATVEEVLNEIETRSEFHFLYNSKLIDVDRRVTVDVDASNIESVLKILFDGTDITYKVSDKQIVLQRKAWNKNTSAPRVEQSEKRITGTVVDESGLPVIGANVVEKGTTNGTVTDMDGKFSLEVNANAKLLISYIGYKEQTVNVANKQNLNIQLVEDTELLDEVVVVGYGVQKKQTVTAAASTLKTDDLENIPAVNLSSTLGGRVSGVLIQQSGGEAGYDDPTIIIRGSSSPTSSSPLIVVDGIIGRSMGQLDPSEVESMTILKDASAVAPYGARGANGVILITTKRGKAGKPSVSYSFKGGFGVPTRLPEIASSYDHARLMNEAWRNKELDMGNDPGAYGIYSEEELIKFRDGTDPYGYPNTNWLKEVLLPRAWQQQHNLTASGGNERVKYFVGLGYVDQDALYGDVRTNTPSSEFKRYNGRVNLDAEIIKDYLNLSADIAYRQEDRNTIANSTSSIFEYMYRNPQTDPGRFPDGKLGKVSLSYNPIGLVTDGGWVKDRQSTINTRFMLDLAVPGVEGLNLKGIFSYDKVFNTIKTWVTPVNFYVWNKITNSYDGSVPNREGADLTQEFTQDQNITMEFQANYNKTIAQDHHLGALFVYTCSEGYDENFWASRTKYRIYSIQQLFAGPDKDKDNSGSASETGKMGSVFRVTYNYKEKYMIEANGRLDGSEKFPKNRRYGFFPSVSVAWRLSSENWMERFSDVISNWKLRASWGKAGTDNIGQFQYMSAYAMGGDVVFGGNSPVITQGYSESRFPNPDITWETSEMFNIGTDLSLWNGLLGLEADFFYKKTSDILRSRSDMPGIVGYTLPAANVGVVDNRGVDMNITHRNEVNDFHYSVTGNLTWARNKVIDLLEPAGTKNNPRQRSTGHPMNQYFGYEALGLFQSDEEADNWPQPQFGQAKAGDIKYKDQNGDGLINDEDQVAIGRSNFPELIFGLNLNAEWKGFDVALFFQGAALANFYYDSYLAHPYLEGVGGTLFEHHINNTWTKDNPNAEFPRLYYGGNVNNRYFSSFWLRDASYLRLKSLEIGYDLKRSLLRNVDAVTGFRIFLTGTNLFTCSSIKYFDPELRSAGGGAYPQMKTYALGVNLTF